MIKCKNLFICAIISVMILLTACGKSSANKSVTEQLTLNEIKELMDSDPKWSNMIELVNEFTSNMTDVQKAQFIGLSYQRLWDYFNTCINSKSTWAEKAKLQWEIMYSKELKQADSTYQYWIDWEKNNRLDNIVKVTPIEFISSGNHIMLRFSVNSQREKIYSMVVRCGTPSGSELFHISIGDPGYTYLDISTPSFFKLTAVSKPIIIFNKDPKFESLLNDMRLMNIIDVIEKYNLSFYADNVTFVGSTENYVFRSSHLEKIPEVLRSLFKENQKAADLDDDTRSKIIVDILQIPDFNEFFFFTHDYIEEQKKGIDELAYKFERSYRL